MPQPVVHFEIIGQDPTKLRSYYHKLFGWESEPSPGVSTQISEQDQYEFINKVSAPDGTGIPGGIGGGQSFQPRTLFYVGVDDVEQTLKKAESFGGERVLGPAAAQNGELYIGLFKDPEGNLVGVAGPG